MPLFGTEVRHQGGRLIGADSVQPVDAHAEAVVARELRLLEPTVRSSPAEVLKLLHPNFVEFGTSGRVWTAAEVANAIAADTEQIDVTDMTAERLAPDVFLLTYRAHRDTGTTLRSSVWMAHEGQWLLRFHQGTSAGR